ncbi:aldo/keto reductase [Streptomyces luteireticuli]|uniref:Aldo/keto reductase n=1 Tax=Streptomyces luteireticuli TaxID=173858 RepID=A0ABP3J5T9_9ACTN
MSAVLGLGTYRVRDVGEAARAACAAGATWVDTAPNYADGLAHAALKPVLADHPGVKVATKTGFFDAEQGRAAVAAGVLTPEQAETGHCLDPAFVGWQVEQSVAELGRHPDIVFVHNPERAALYEAHVHAQLRAAFMVLEELVEDCTIGGYGVATWSGMRSGLLDERVLDRLAREAAGGGERHYLVAVQQPVSLVEDASIRQALQGHGPVVNCRGARMQTFASAPLDGGRLLDLMSPELADFIRPGASVAAASLLVTASTPGLDVVLVSASTPSHWAEAAEALADPLDPAHLQEVIDVCAGR